MIKQFLNYFLRRMNSTSEEFYNEAEIKKNLLKMGIRNENGKHTSQNLSNFRLVKFIAYKNLSNKYTFIDMSTNFETKPKLSKLLKKNDVNMNEYFDFFQNRYPPDIGRYSKKYYQKGNYDCQGALSCE